MACVAIPGLSFQSRDDGVVHIVMPSRAASPRYNGTEFCPALRFRKAAHFSSVSGDRSRFTLVAVGHKPKSISSMGRIDGTSRNNSRPAGVADAFQVRMHSVEPILSNRCRNLLSHDDSGAGGSDEVEEDRPEVTFVRLALLLASD